VSTAPTATPTSAATLNVGRSIPSRTNAALAAGRGTFVADLDFPGMAWLAVVRSPYAHARIRSVDATVARARPGVLLVLTGEDIADTLGPIPTGADNGAMGAKSVTWHALARERVRYVGEAVAVVVAEDRATAYAAREDIAIDYEELPVVADPLGALRSDSPLVEPAWGNNVILRRDFVIGEAPAALARARRIARGSLRSSRISGSPIETRGAVASHDPSTGRLTFHEPTQQPHVLRTFLAETLDVPEHAIRVVQTHVGGAFGLKQPLYQEEAILAEAARRLGRPVKWIEERTEALTAGGHSRDTRLEYEVAFEPDGTITGLRARVLADVGAPTSLLGWTMSFVTAYCLPTVYRIPNVLVELVAVVTNSCPWAPYRGFGKDAASFLMERVMDRVARETGLDRTEVRLRNLIPPDVFPYERSGGAILDSGDYPGLLRRLTERVDYHDFARVKAAARREGRRLGLGIAFELTPEGVAIPGSLMNSAWDGATVRIDPSGGVSVLAGVTTPGSGNETAIAQICADALGVPLAAVRVVQGDTDACPYGLGNYSSRSVMIGGTAVREAALQLRAKLGDVARSMLGLRGEAPIDHRDGWIGSPSAGGDTRIRYTDVVTEVYRHTFGRHAESVEPGLEATRYWRIGNIYHQPETQGRFSTYPTWPSAAAACVVEVDEDTGMIRIVRWTLVEDAGVIVNPLLADANLHGAIAQGIGSALCERMVYDESGQPLAATLMDYTLPTAVELPMFEIEHQQTPSPFTPLGTKGVGESGLSSSLGALASAVEDAFPELDLRLERLPLDPAEVWRAIRAARNGTSEESA
jgi:carbon-monoxide dehydrogenase large subunit